MAPATVPPATAETPAVVASRDGEDLPAWVASRGSLAPHTVVVEQRRWTRGAKATAALLAVLLVGAVAGLGYAWWHERSDRQDLEKDLNSAAATSAQQVTQLTKERDQAVTRMNTGTQQLDAATAKAAGLQRQLTLTQARLKVAEGAAAAALSQARSLRALFPLSPSKLAAGLPGTYVSTVFNVAAGGCSRPACPLQPLSIAITGTGPALTARAANLGQATLHVVGGVEWAGAGTAGAPFQLRCNAAPQATTFSWTLAPGSTGLVGTASQVTLLAGRLVLTAAAVGGATPCPAGIAVYDLVAERR
jgi:hypothetical protein